MTEIKNTVLGSVKKPYIKPDFEVINLEDMPKLLAASGATVGTSGLTDGGEI